VEKAKIMFPEMGVPPHIEFINLPTALRGKYQDSPVGKQRKAAIGGLHARPALRMASGSMLETTMKPPTPTKESFRSRPCRARS